MTQEEALEEFKKLRPESADKLRVEREHSIGYTYGATDSFRLWDCSGSKLDLISSTRSWDHALAMAKSGDEDCWPEDNSPIAEAQQ